MCPKYHILQLIYVTQPAHPMNIIVLYSLICIFINVGSCGKTLDDIEQIKVDFETLYLAEGPYNNYLKSKFLFRSKILILVGVVVSTLKGRNITLASGENETDYCLQVITIKSFLDLIETFSVHCIQNPRLTLHFQKNSKG